MPTMSTGKLRRVRACVDSPIAWDLSRYRTLSGWRHTPAGRTVARWPNLTTVGFVPSCGRVNTDRQRPFPTHSRHNASLQLMPTVVLRLRQAVNWKAWSGIWQSTILLSCRCFTCFFLLLQLGYQI